MSSPTRRDRVTFGRILPRVERTLSIRLTVPAVSLPYHQPLPDIDPEASNTIMASSVQGECSSWPVVTRSPKAGTAAAVKAIAATLQERVGRGIDETLTISSKRLPLVLPHRPHDCVQVLGGMLDAKYSLFE